jgi:hypothetical protein
MLCINTVAFGTHSLYPYNQDLCMFYSFISQLLRILAVELKDITINVLYFYLKNQNIPRHLLGIFY